jgi:hypothetical protein
MAGVLLEEILHPLVIDFQVGNLPTRKVLPIYHKKENKTRQDHRKFQVSQKQKEQFPLFNS